ncbi:MAG: DNA gyrase inhibitor YacG [Litorivicinaceae bacterium]
MTDSKGRIVSCPTCKKETRYHANNTSRPFCSERCRLIDLGEWADEGHRIPGKPVPTEFDDPEIDTH